MRKLTLVMGLPLSGKTSYAKSISGAHIEIEALRRTASGGGSYTSGAEDLVFHLATKSLVYHLEHESHVALDDLFLSAKERQSYVKVAKKLGAVCELHWLDLSRSKIFERCREKQLFISDSLAEFSRKLEMPTISEGYEHIFYRSDGDFI